MAHILTNRMTTTTKLACEGDLDIGLLNGLPGNIGTYNRGVACRDEGTYGTVPRALSKDTRKITPARKQCETETLQVYEKHVKCGKIFKIHHLFDFYQ